MNVTVRRFVGVTGLAAAMAFSALVAVGCSEKPDDGGGGLDGRDTTGLVLGSNEAWISENGGGGVVFKANGEFVGIQQNENTGKWYGLTSEEVKWSVDGDKLVLKIYEPWDNEEYSIGSSYNISGKTLTLTIYDDDCDWENNREVCCDTTYTSYEIQKYTKTSITYRSLDNGGDGGNPVLPDGYAWVRTETYSEGYTYTSGYIYKANGDWIRISKFGENSWSGYKRGTWKVQGGFLVVTYDDGYTNREPFGVSDNTLTFYYEDYTKTQVGEVKIYEDNMHKSRNAKKRLPEKPLSGKGWGLLSRK